MENRRLRYGLAGHCPGSSLRVRQLHALSVEVANLEANLHAFLGANSRGRPPGDGGRVFAIPCNEPRKKYGRALKESEPSFEFLRIGVRSSNQSSSEAFATSGITFDAPGAARTEQWYACCWAVLFDAFDKARSFPFHDESVVDRVS